MPQSKNRLSTFDKPKWLVRVKFTNDAEMTFSLTTREIRTYITENSGSFEGIGSEAGIVNKYVYPCVFARIDNRPVKHIKIRGK